MAPKTKRKCIADALEDLEPEQLEKFRHQLLDRKRESRVRRAMVKDKNYMDLADVLVSTFTEDGAVKVTEELLKEIGCHGAAKDLGKYIYIDLMQNERQFYMHNFFIFTFTFERLNKDPDLQSAFSRILFYLFNNSTKTLMLQAKAKIVLYISKKTTDWVLHLVS